MTALRRYNRWLRLAKVDKKSYQVEGVRWMLEREVGAAAADVVVRTRRGAARKDIRRAARRAAPHPPPERAVDQVLIGNDKIFIAQSHEYANISEFCLCSTNKNPEFWGFCLCCTNKFL